MVDRPFRHGDVVRWATAGAAVAVAGDVDRDRGSALGRVVEVHVAVDLRMLDNGALVAGVDARRDVAKVRALAAGDVVVRGAWAGRVLDLEERVTVALDADRTARCAPSCVHALPGTLVPRAGSARRDTAFPYHPRQRVMVAAPRPLLRARWWPGSGGGGRYRCGRVVRVRTHVTWRGRRAAGSPGPCRRSRWSTAGAPGPGSWGCGLWPGDLVTQRRRAGGGPSAEPSRRRGVVQRVGAARQAVVVRWLGEPSAEAGGAEETLRADAIDDGGGGEIGDLVMRTHSPHPAAAVPSSEPGENGGGGWGGRGVSTSKWRWRRRRGSCGGRRSRVWDRCGR